jgi:hypothetical protein
MAARRGSILAFAVAIEAQNRPMLQKNSVSRHGSLRITAVVTIPFFMYLFGWAG